MLLNGLLESDCFERDSGRGERAGPGAEEISELSKKMQIGIAHHSAGGMTLTIPDRSPYFSMRWM